MEEKMERRTKRLKNVEPQYPKNDRMEVEKR
jgi:hypothetical protein